MSTPALVTPETTPKKSNHRANVVRIQELFPHNNSDNLALVHIDNYQVVVRKDQVKVGDLAVYIQPDSVVPQTEPFKFIWGEHVGLDGKVPEKRRRVTVRKFRGEWSEGLLLPLSDFGPQPGDGESGHTTVLVGVKESDDVSDLLGVTHYDPDAGVEGTAAPNARAPKRKFRYPKTFKGWAKFIWRHLTGHRKEAIQDVPFTLPVYDVESYKNYKDVFEPGEYVVITEKIHGSNARFLFLEGVMYAGSRTQWKALDSNCVWSKALKQNPWIEEWCREHEGYALYGEVTPTQKSFTYGCKKDEVRFFIFDILSPESKWLGFYDYLWFCDALYTHFVPLLYLGEFDESLIATLVNGASIEGNHIREGIVIKPVYERFKHGLGRVQLKAVSNDFLAKDSK